MNKTFTKQRICGLNVVKDNFMRMYDDLLMFLL